MWRKGLLRRKNPYVFSLWVILAAVLAAPFWTEASEAMNGMPSSSLSATGKETSSRRDIPILLYHHIVEDDASESQISESTIYRSQFEREMEFLVERGFQTVTFRQIIDYVESGAPLPENPVCLTFDDGYLSNYKIAYPILKEHQMKATIFVIGATVGNREHYKRTHFPITPHFDYSQAKEMSGSGLISIQTHTYDMHQRAEFETGDRIHKNILRLPEESREEYAAFLKADFERAKTEIEEATGQPVEVLAYPGGSSDRTSESLLRSFGVKATLSIQPGKAVLIRGQVSSLSNMNRFYVKSTTTQEVFQSWFE